MLAARASDLEQMGVTDPQQGSLVDVLIRAAIGTDAEVLMVPAGTPDSPDGGVGALLRYSDNADGAGVQLIVGRGSEHGGAPSLPGTL